MGFYTTSKPAILTAFVIAVILVDLVVSGPIPVEPTKGRALRSVSSHRRNAVTNLLLSQQQQLQQANDTENPFLAQREIQTGDGSYAEDDDGDGSNEVELEGDGTFSNNTQAGSRLKPNSTEPCSLEPAILCSSSDPTHSNRDKQRRLANIVNYLWKNLFENRTRPVNKETMNEPLNANPMNPSSSSFSGGLESIAATCDLPPEVESEAWSSERYYSIYFNLTSKYSDILGSLQTSAEISSNEPQAQQLSADGESLESGHSQEYLPVSGSQPFITTLTVTPSKTVSIITGKLRLYKIGTPENANNVPPIADIERISEPCNDTDVTLDEDMVPNVLPITTRVTFPEFSPSVDEKIRVSVFWYTQPATKNHYKKKLVDAKMLSLKESGWVEFDIKNAVRAWLNERKPNYGLVIEVENENQDPLDPRNYFRSAPCFKSSSSSVGPNDDKQEGTGGNVDTAMSPIIEICSLNVPEATTSYEHTKTFPFSMNLNSLSHLQRVAESHARSSNGSSGQPRFPFSQQSINLRYLSPEDFGFADPNANENNDAPRQTIVVPNHRHRHHHQLASQQNGNRNNQRTEQNGGKTRHQRNRARSNNNGPQQFTLADDHPLRQILANVNSNSKESSKRVSGTQQFSDSISKGFPSHLIHEMPADEGRAEADYLDSTEHDRDVFITKIIISPAQLQQKALSGLANGRGFLPFASSMPTSSSVVTPTVSTNDDSLER